MSKLNNQKSEPLVNGLQCFVSRKSCRVHALPLGIHPWRRTRAFQHLREPLHWSAAEVLWFSRRKRPASTKNQIGQYVISSRVHPSVAWQECAHMSGWINIKVKAPIEFNFHNTNRLLSLDDRLRCRKIMVKRPSTIGRRTSPHDACPRKNFTASEFSAPLSRR